MRINERVVMRIMRYVLLAVLVTPAILWSKYSSIDPCEILRQEFTTINVIPGEYDAESQIYYDYFMATTTGDGCTTGVLKLAWIRIS